MSPLVLSEAEDMAGARAEEVGTRFIHHRTALLHSSE